MLSSNSLRIAGIIWGAIFLILSAFLLYEGKEFLLPLTIAILGSLMFFLSYHLMKRIEKIRMKE